jgi:hypothetical protein
MRKSKGSLTFPSNPLARLQELRAEVEGASLPTTTETSNEVLEDASNDASNEVSSETDLAGEGMTARVRLLPVKPPSREPTSRLNVELRDSLHTRLKTYCARHKVPIRLVIDALLEDFLTEAERERS